MERNELVLYLDIPEFSEALYASKWHSDIVLPQAVCKKAAFQYIICKALM